MAILGRFIISARVTAPPPQGRNGSRQRLREEKEKIPTAPSHSILAAARPPGQVSCQDSFPARLPTSYPARSSREHHLKLTFSANCF